MENFCNNCGSIIPDGSIVCPVCGASSEDAQTPVKKKSKVGVIIAVLVVVCAIVVAAFIFVPKIIDAINNEKAKSIADKAMVALWEDHDAKDYIALIHDDVIEASADDNDMSVSEFEEEFQGGLDTVFGYIAEVGKWEISWEISEVKDVKKSKLEDYQDYYDDEYDLKVTDAKTVIVESEMSVDTGDEEDTQKDKKKIIIVKIDGDWYLDTEYTDPLLEI